MEWVCCGTTELLIELLAGRTTTKIPLPDQWRYYPRNPYYDYNVVVRSASDSYFESKPKIVTTPAPQHPPIIHQKPRMNKLLPSVAVLQLLSGGFIQHGNFSESLRLSSNVVLVKDGPCYLVVNTGLPYQKNDIIKNLASAGATSTDVQFLIITSALPQFLGSLNLFQSAQLITEKHFVYRDHVLQGIIQEDVQIETCSRNTYLFATPGPTANSVTLIAKNVPSMGRVAIAGALFLHDDSITRIDDSFTWNAAKMIESRRKIICQVDWIVPAHSPPFPVSTALRHMAECHLLKYSQS
ncbi:hypothetical protein WR25_22808 [Diploscapter pachys]|uniref:Metallo-beta-lactamase domain-containing protein n=1 Tax=Diploscapter pachys TaxID=2018661 RepID=A0A2A2JJK7_9BILA|nr:hypothetical protein WR25_22808 [Diploscapter pachys]